MDPGQDLGELLWTQRVREDLFKEMPLEPRRHGMLDRPSGSYGGNILLSIGSQSENRLGKLGVSHS